MRSSPSPTDKYDQKELARLKVETWQVDLLKLNPRYPHWGPHEDYMWVKGDGWNSPINYTSWKEFNITLDEYNEVVNFYFALSRDSKECPTCEGSGYHPHARWIADSFYNHSSPFRTSDPWADHQLEAVRDSFDLQMPTLMPVRIPPDEMFELYGQPFSDFCADMRKHKCWHLRITQDEVQALLDSHRLWDLTREWVDSKWVDKDPPVVPTADEVNAWAGLARGMSHDGINRSILIEQRCKRLEIPIWCPECENLGHVYTAPAGHVQLVLWLLHPRKCASRGVEVELVEREDLPAIFTFLRTAAERNADRFAMVVAP